MKKRINAVVCLRVDIQLLSTGFYKDSSLIGIVCV